MGLYARLNLMMNGPNIQVALEAFEGSLYLGQLGISLPEHFGYKDDRCASSGQ